MRTSVKIFAFTCITFSLLGYAAKQLIFPANRGFDIWPAANYHMEGTDFIQYDSFRFARPGVEFSDLEFSVSSTFQTLWNYIVPSHIMDKLFHRQTFKSQKAMSILDAYFKSTWTQPVDILDARKRDIKFADTGFELFKDDAFMNIDWDKVDTPEVMQQLEEIMTPMIKAQYPNASRLKFSPPILRTAVSLRAVNAPHIDYVPSDEMREAFHAKNPVHKNQKLMPCLLGQCDTEEDQLGMILGAWVPTMKTPVCDKPLAIMDASSSTADNVTPIVSRAKLFRRTLSQMFAIINWSPSQRWYYYSYQKPNEVLLFHHYNKDKSHAWANPHSSMTVSGCGSEYESRSSTEVRVIVFFPKDKEESVTRTE